MRKFMTGDSILEFHIEESTIEGHWRKWSSVEDEASNEIEIEIGWIPKQMALGEMRKRKQHLLDRVYSTYYDEYTLLIDFKTGKVYHFDNSKYKEVMDGVKIYLIDIFSNQKHLVYDGVFYAASGELMKSNPWLSSRSSLGIEWRKKGFRTGRLFIKDHQLIAVLYFGSEAVNAVGENRSYDINHRNLSKYDNRPENLEVISKSENKEHSKIMNRLLNNMIQEVFGKKVKGVWLPEEI
ncbi:HNH endonuclease [Paenibacillus sp. DMB5]|uniref:HNH endonuclease n=1 Tax=Paenibacillus sp. DMB5 TaxID=1780103 RepID=UPI00076C6059|nr:HNH endonuclease [Paenibacillus sp. DMB5]KUP23097.1 hypothetical protein AWJ19_22735 [Paenibacillus sp. DMB5]